MARYIELDKLVAEIERVRKYQRLDDRHSQGILDGLHAIEKFINTLEVKEVDFDNHTIMEEIRKCGCNPSEFDVARHFFELGIKAKQC